MSTVVRARIDEKTKEEAAAVLDAIGLTVSDAFRLMMVRIAAEKRLPFEPLVPNPETVAAMEAARLATAALHLACAELGIWHAVTAFEGAMPMVRDDEVSEQTLARLAGLQATSGTRIGPSYEALLAQLRPRPEALKVLVLIHDGEPEDGSKVRQLNADAADARIEVLGLGVALEAKNRAAMRELFAGRFIDCPTPAALAPLLAGVVNTFRRT